MILPPIPLTPLHLNGTVMEGFFQGGDRIIPWFKSGTLTLVSEPDNSHSRYYCKLSGISRVLLFDDWAFFTTSFVESEGVISTLEVAVEVTVWKRRPGFGQVNPYVYTARSAYFHDGMRAFGIGIILSTCLSRNPLGCIPKARRQSELRPFWTWSVSRRPGCSRGG